MSFLSSILARLSRRSDESCHEPLAEPQRDWSILIAALLVLCALFALAGIGLYFLYAGAASAPPASASAAAGPSAGELQQMLSTYGGRDSEHDTLLTSAPALPDPSQAK